MYFVSEYSDTIPNTAHAFYCREEVHYAVTVQYSALTATGNRMLIEYAKI